jgi:hypothetical protein
MIPVLDRQNEKDPTLRHVAQRPRKQTEQLLQTQGWELLERQGAQVRALRQFGNQSAAQDHRDRVDVGLLAGTPKLSPLCYQSQLRN